MMKSLKKPEFLWTRVLSVLEPLEEVGTLRISAPEIIKGILVACFLAFFFYRSLPAVIPMSVPAGLMIWWDRKKAEKNRNRQLLRQFSECILSVGGAVRAGYAAENAFVESMKDMEMMYGADAEIMEELAQIKGGLVNNRSLERLLQEMGQRTQLEEILEFAEIFAITKRNGGSLAEIINLTAVEIGSSLEGAEEIQTLLASKKLEQAVMNLMPFLLVLYLQATTPGYFDMFYHDFTGCVMMSVFLVWYLAAYALSEYILWKAVG